MLRTENLGVMRECIVEKPFLFFTGFTVILNVFCDLQEMICVADTFFNPEYSKNNTVSKWVFRSIKKSNCLSNTFIKSSL